MEAVSGAGFCGLDRLAEILRRAERHFLARLDLDRLTRGGVPSHAGGPLTHLKGSEPGDADTRTLLKVFADQAHCTVTSGVNSAEFQRIEIRGDLATCCRPWL